MYPETDVPPTPIEDEFLSLLRARLPETAEQLVGRLMERYSLNAKLARQLMDSDYLPLYERIVASGKVQTTFAATFLTETCKSLEREGVAVRAVPDEKIGGMFRLIENGAIAKEALSELLKWSIVHPTEELNEGVRSLGLRMLDEKEVERVVDQSIEKNRALVEQRGQGAFPSIMGTVMSEMRGRADPKLVTEIVKKRLAAR